MKKALFLFVLIFIVTFSALADTTYVVQKGDTLYSISKKYQITVAELRTANNFSDKDVLKAGQKLVIPEADLGTAAALTSKKTENQNTEPAKTSKLVTKDYTVAKGDTLYGIARNNAMSVAELLSLNNLDSSAVIKVGQKLKIKSDKTEVAAKIEKETVARTSAAPSKTTVTTIDVNEKVPDTRNYGNVVVSDSNTKWPVKNPKVTSVKGKVSGVQLSAKENEVVTCVHEGTVMYVGVYRGFGQVVFIQSKTGLIYAYTGLGSVKIKKGDYAVSGADIGTAGVDPISKNSQIQFMVFQNGQPIDPVKAPRN